MALWPASVSHSPLLLQVIQNCRMASPKPKQMGLLAFNNYDLADSVSMLETFLKAFDAARYGAAGAGGGPMLQGLFKVVETVTTAMGIQFTPNQRELGAMVQSEYDTAVPTTCFRFALSVPVPCPGHGRS